VENICDLPFVDDVVERIHIIGVEKEKKKTDLRIFAGARVSFIIINICLVGMVPIRFPLAPDQYDL
ncbi:unnamed protein product, partial [Brassica oleracea var. botrytis]